MTARTRKAAERDESTEDRAEVAAPDADAKGGKGGSDDGEQAGPRQVRHDADGDGKDDGTAYLNVSGSMITYDTVGHQVAPGEWVGPLHLDKIGRGARSAGHLLPTSAVS